MVALSVILFSGGMDTKFKEIRPILSPGIVLSTVGVFLTALFAGCVSYTHLDVYKRQILRILVQDTHTHLSGTTADIRYR